MRTSVPGVGPASTREVEVKYRVHDVDSVTDALAAAGVVLLPAVRQDDQAYAPVGWDYGMSKIGVVFARLRSQDGRHLFTVKRPVDNEMVCVEHETGVADRDRMHEALLLMGFRPTVRIVKTRRTGHLGVLSVCVDQVDGLGAFLEVEQLVEPGDAGLQAQRRLDVFARGLGAAVEQVSDTYDTLLHCASAVVSG